MKILLTGPTGFIGAEVLSLALQHPRITSVVALSRRPLEGPLASHPKLQTVLMTEETFLTWPAEILDKVAGAAGAVWALGIPFPKDMEVYRRVNVEYVEKAVGAWGSALEKGTMGDGKREGKARGKFRFAYCSGALPVRDQDAKLWFLEEGRKMRGEAENAVIQAAETYAGMDGFVLKPAYVLSRHAGFLNSVAGGALTIRVQDLAAALLESAMDGSGAQVEESAVAGGRGRLFLEREGREA